MLTTRTIRWFWPPGRVDPFLIHRERIDVPCDEPILHDCMSAKICDLIHTVLNEIQQFT
jgi:hypothetical protein